MAKSEVTIPLEQVQIAFLEPMAKKYSLADTSKVVRCLIEFGRDCPDEQDRIFSEIRCHNC